MNNWQALASFWGMITGANPDVVIVVLTGVIAGTTIVYAWVTWRLLTQTRWAFLVDTIIRVMGPTEERIQQYFNETIGKMNQRARKISDWLRKVEVGKDIKKQWQGQWHDVEMRWDEARLQTEVESYVIGICRAIGTTNKKLARDFHKSLRSYQKEMIRVRKDVINKIESVKDEVERLSKEVEKQAKSEET